MSERTVVEPRPPARAGPGTRLNDLYEIDALLAAGGMGEVFRGHAIETGDAVAIKTIRPDFAGNAQALALFRKEAAALRDVHHGAVVRYYVFSIDRRLDLPYLAMEFVTGESLAERLRSGPLSFEEVEILRRRLAGGLQAAHEAGIVHRDISPDNVILPGGDPARAKIIDFGIARSATGQTVIGDGFAGKYDYVSPEQLGLQGGDVTARSDIYSLGLVLAEASRGRRVDMGGSPAEFVARRSALPDLAGLDARLRPLIEAMLQPDPSRRPESMAAVESWRPVARDVPRAIPPARRGRVVALVLGTLALAAAVVAALLLSRPETTAPPQAGGPALSERPVPAEAPRLDTAPAEQAAPGGRTAPSGPALPPASEPPEGKAATAPLQTPGSEPGPDQADGGRGRNTPTVSESPSQGAAAPENRPKPATAPVAPPVTPPTAPSPTPIERVAAFIRDYRGGPCFFLNPTAVGAASATVEAYGTDPAPARAFDAAFRAAFGFEARIQLRQIESGQCPVIELLAAQAQAKPAGVPILQIDADRIRGGDELKGRVEWGDPRSLRLWLVEGDGTLHDLTGSLKRGEGRAGFAVRLERPAGDPWRPQLLVAVSGGEAAARQGSGRQTEALFPALARQAASPGGAVGVAVRYLKVGG